MKKVVSDWEEGKGENRSDFVIEEVASIKVFNSEWKIKDKTNEKSVKFTG